MRREHAATKRRVKDESNRLRGITWQHINKDGHTKEETERVGVRPRGDKAEAGRPYYDEKMSRDEARRRRFYSDYESVDDSREEKLRCVYPCSVAGHKQY